MRIISPGGSMMHIPQILANSPSGLYEYKIRVCKASYDVLQP